MSNKTKKQKLQKILDDNGFEYDSCELKKNKIIITLKGVTVSNTMPKWFKVWNETQFKPLKEDVKTLKEDVKILQEDVKTLKEDVKVLQEDVKTLKEDVVTLKANQKAMMNTPTMKKELEALKN